MKEKRKILAVLLVALGLCGCGTIAKHLADAIEPRLERIVDAQIEREEKLAGIWGTTNSYFYAERSAEEEAIRAEAADMVAVWSDEILQQLDAMISAKLKKGGR